jgi:hypothetical protein
MQNDMREAIQFFKELVIGAAIFSIAPFFVYIGFLVD